MRGFTLIELISVIAIIAVVAIVGFFYLGPVILNVRQQMDKETLYVLNDALNRYKCQGGDINALTAGAPISHVLARMASTLNFGGMKHQVLQKGTTYVGRSIDSIGDKAQYRFTRYNTYTAEAGGSSPTAPSGPSLGAGEGYMANGGWSGTYNGGEVTAGYFVWPATTTGFIAFKDASGATTVYAADTDPNNWNVEVDLPASSSYTFWSCAGASDSTKSGDITLFDCDTSHLTAIDITGLLALQILDCGINQLTSLNVSGLTNLQQLYCVTNQLTSLNVSGLTNLQKLYCYTNQLTSLNVSGLTNLQQLYCYTNQLTSLNVSGLTNLQYLECGANQLTSLNVSGLTNLQYLYCYTNQLTSLNASGLTNLQQLYCYTNQLGTIDVTGCTSLPAPSTDTSTLFRIQGNPSANVVGP